MIHHHQNNIIGKSKESPPRQKGNNTRWKSEFTERMQTTLNCKHMGKYDSVADASKFLQETTERL